jgi:FkbM family methyltransferase
MSIIKSGSLVFDIGANVGQMATRFLDAGAGKVICVEPCRENYLQLVNMPRIIAVHAAAWNKNSILPISYSKKNSGLSSCQPDKWSKAYPDADWDAPQWTPAVTLNDLISAFGVPQLLKVDVEGSEVEVLSALSIKLEFVIFEFHQKFKEDVIEVLRMMRALGFAQAHYTQEEIDLETVPTMDINSMEKQWLEAAPEWGQITLS